MKYFPPRAYCRRLADVETSFLLGRAVTSGNWRPSLPSGKREKEPPVSCAPPGRESCLPEVLILLWGAQKSQQSQRGTSTPF